MAVDRGGDVEIEERGVLISASQGRADGEEGKAEMRGKARCQERANGEEGRARRRAAREEEASGGGASGARSRGVPRGRSDAPTARVSRNVMQGEAASLPRRAREAASQCTVGWAEEAALQAGERGGGVINAGRGVARMRRVCIAVV